MSIPDEAARSTWREMMQRYSTDGLTRLLEALRSRDTRLIQLSTAGCGSELFEHSEYEEMRNWATPFWGDRIVASCCPGAFPLWREGQTVDELELTFSRHFEAIDIGPFLTWYDNEDFYKALEAMIPEVERELSQRGVNLFSDIEET